MIPTESMLSDYTRVPRLAANSVHYDLHCRIVDRAGWRKNTVGWLGVKDHKKRPPTQHLSMSVFILMGYLMGGVGVCVSFLPYTWAKMENYLILGYHNRLDSCISFKIEVIILTSQSRLWYIFIYCFSKILHARRHFHPTRSQTSKKYNIKGH